MPKVKISDDIQRLLKEKHAAKRRGNAKDIADTCNALGAVYADCGDYDNAIEQHSEELQFSLSAGDRIGAAIAHRKLAENYALTGNFETAVDEAQQYLRLSEESSDWSHVQLSWHVLGRTYLQYAESLHSSADLEQQNCRTQSGSGQKRSKLLREAQLCFEKSLQECDTRLENILRHQELVVRRAGVYQNLGTIAAAQLRHNEALNHCTIAIELATQIKNNDLLHRTNYALAEMMFQRGQLTIASEHAAKVVHYAELEKNKEAMFDGLLLLAYIHLSDDNFKKAKSKLEMAKKRARSGRAEEDDLVDLILWTKRLCKYRRSIDKNQSTDYKRLKKLHEKIGDILCTHFPNAGLKVVELALTYYKKMEEYGRLCGGNKTDLIPCYVSLSQTCLDLGWYDDALYYLERQLEAEEGDPRQMCKTLMTLADTAEKATKTDSSIIDYYSRAVELAKECNDLPLLARVHHEFKSFLCLYQRENELFQTISDAYEDLKEHYTPQDEEDDEDQRSDTSEDSLSEISDDSSSAGISNDEADELNTSNIVVCRRSGYKTRRNEKGETELHRACIDGQYKAVERLLNKGHPANELDYAKWTPLHEACNWDHVDIIRLLVQHGADIEARGLDGVTPLLDAAAAGSFNTVNVLLDLGASVAAVDNKGHTVLDHLRSYKRTESETFEYDALVKRIKEKLLRDGVSVPVSENRARDSIFDNEIYSQSDRPDNILHNRRQKCVADSITRAYRPATSKDSAASLYKSAIASVGRSAARPASFSSVESEETRGAGSKKRDVQTGALVTEAEYEVSDDWMVDDCVPIPTTASTNNKKPSFTTRNGVENKISGRTTATKRRTHDDIFEADSEITDFGETRHASFEAIRDELPVIVDEFPNVQRQKRPRFRQTRLPASHVVGDVQVLDERPATSHATAPRPPPVAVMSNDFLRVNVVVEDKKFAVILRDRTCTIDWLADKVSAHYETATGRRPFVRLYTSDDAVLNGNDTVEFLFHHNEQLIGKVERMVVLDFEDSYRQVCQRLKLDVFEDICLALRDASKRMVLDLHCTCLRMAGGTSVILKTLQFEYGLVSLNFSGQSFTVDEATELATVVQNLKSLQTLILSCTGWRCDHLRALSDEISKRNANLKVLEKLDLSFNDLGDGSVQHLARLLQNCPRMTSLNLECIGATEKFGRDLTSAYRDVFTGLPLTEVNLSKNLLSSLVEELRTLLPNALETGLRL